MKASEYFKSLPGDNLQLNTNELIDLRNIDSLYWVEEGELDLFMYHSGQYLKGPKSYLISIKSGEFLLPFQLETDDQYQIVATGIRASKLKKISFSQFHNLTDNIAAGVSQQLSLWIKKLSTLFTLTTLPNDIHFITSDSSYLCKGPEKIIYGTQDETPQQIWVKASHPVSLMGVPSLEIAASSEPFPLTPSIWLQCPENTQLDFISSQMWIKDNACWNGLLNFNRLALISRYIYLMGKSLREQSTLASGIVYQNEELRNAFLNMQTLISHEEISDIAGVEKHFPTKVYEAIGTYLEQPFTIPDKALPADLEEQIDLIARNSLVYYRRIYLPQKWWKKDSGALFGLYQKAKKIVAVALLPNPTGGYSIVGLHGNQQVPFSTHMAEKLKSMAYIFYRHFPFEAKLTNKNIFAFCVDGRGREFWFALTAAALGTAISLLIPFALGFLFDYVLKESNISLLWQVVAGLFIISVCSTIFMVAREIALLRLESQCYNDLEFAIWQRVLDLPLSFFREFSMGTLSQRLEGIANIRKELAGYGARVLLNAVFISFYLIAMIYYAPKIAIVLIIFVIINQFCMFQGIKRIIDLSNQISEIDSPLHGKIVQAILGITKLRSSGAEKRIFVDWSNLFMKIKRLDIKSGVVQSFLYGLGNVFPLLTFFLITLFLIMDRTSEGQINLSVGSYIGFTAAFAIFSAVLIDLNNFAITVAVLWSKFQRNRHSIDAPIEVRGPEVSSELGELTGEIRMDHLFFRFDPTSAYIHNDISLHVNPGEYIAVVGYSGSGKSSLAKLLLGFEKPEKGGIYYNGINLMEINVRDLRSQIGVVLQNSMIISGTLRDNITCGRKFSDAEILKAIDMAGFKKDLDELPMGLKTILISGGGTLAGGQRQRIILARALVGNPKILILDEATNALDNVTQQAIVKMLDNYHVTRIVIAHRLSTIQNAHRIYVLDKGKFVQAGSYQELLQQGGLFADFVAHQEL